MAGGAGGPSAGVCARVNREEITVVFEEILDIANRVAGQTGCTLIQVG